MAIYKCKMCGDTLSISNGQSVVTCDSCGTTQTVHGFDNEKKITFFKRANALRFKCEFDKAAGLYETIVSEFPTESEAYWGLVLCKFGIEYVDDPRTGEKIPTCHRTQFASIFDDFDYKNAIKNADAVAEAVYKKEANEISKLQKNILEISSKEEPFDIFICYKETDSNNNRTIDSVLAQDIYKELTNEGYKVFFSRITLEDKLGSQYEPYIFAALHSSKIMLHVTTSDENSEAIWVRNEWSRYLSLIRQGQKKVLIPCYKNISPYSLPDEMQNLQGQDMGKLGSMQDLLRGIDKILGRHEKKVQTITSTNNNTPSEQDTFESQVRKGYIYLSKKMWVDAEETFSNAIKIIEKCGRAYIGLMLAQGHETSIESFLKNKGYSDDGLTKLDLAKSFADSKCLEQLSDIEKKIELMKEQDSRNYFTNLLEKELWNDAKSYLKKQSKLKDEFIEMYNTSVYDFCCRSLNKKYSISELPFLNELTVLLRELKDFGDSNLKLSLCSSIKEKIIDDYIAETIESFKLPLDENLSLKSFELICTKLLENKNRIKTISPFYDQIQENYEIIQDSGYKFLQQKSYDLILSFDHLNDCVRLENILKSLNRDDIFAKIYEAIDSQRNSIEEVTRTLKRKKRIKTLKISSIVSAALAIFIASGFGIKAIVDESKRNSTYNSASTFMNNGEYDKAIEYYKSLANYKDSQNKIDVCNGMKELQKSIDTKSEQDAINGIKKIVNAGEKVDVTYTSSGNHTVKRKLLNNNNNNTFSDSYFETIDNPNFTLYQPGVNNGYTFINWNSLEAKYNSNRACLTLNSNWSLNFYSISYVLDGGINSNSNPKQYTIESSDISLYNATKDNYQFLGWFDRANGGNKITEIKQGNYGDITLYAHWEINHYDVKFYNDSVLLETVSVPHGGTAVYSKSTPIKNADAQYTYTFTGWDKLLTNVTTSFSTYAQFSNTLNSYKVIFYDYDRTTVLDSCTVNYGSNAVYSKPIPTRETDDNFVYTFNGWDKPLSTPIVGDTAFYATYSTVARYMCRFFVENVEMYREVVTKGENAHYPYSTPTKQSTQQYTFSFVNWDKSLNNIQENTDFNAVFSNIVNKYTVTFVNWDNSVLYTDTVEYGTSASYKGETPTREMDNSYKYTFLKWDRDFSNVTEDITVKALFTNKNRYLCRFYDYDGSLLQSSYVTEGEPVKYNGKTPIRQKDQQYSYTFSSWDNDLNSIVGNTDFHPIFNATTNKYTVTFINWNGEPLGSCTVDYGTKATYSGSLPQRETDNFYKYTFNGWDVSLENITDNITATAQFSLTNRYLCNFENYDGTILFSEYVTEGETAVFNGETPTRTRTQQYTYVFSGWDKPLDNICSHTTFTALYDSVINNYKVTFVNYDDTILYQIDVPYGNEAKYVGETPIKPITGGFAYTFVGWDKDLSNVIEDVTTKAVFTATEDINYTFELNSDCNTYKLVKFEGTYTDIVIPEEYNGKPITIIGENAFKGKKISSVTIPDCITKIEDRAFSSCDLEYVKFKTTSNLEYIGEEAFRAIRYYQKYEYRTSSYALYYITPNIFIPSKVTYIGKNAFYNSWSYNSSHSTDPFNDYTRYICSMAENINGESGWDNWGYYINGSTSTYSLAKLKYSSTKEQGSFYVDSDLNIKMWSYDD